MKTFYVEATNHTPEVHLKSDGELIIKGKSLPENTAIFFKPIFDWVTECTIANIRFTIDLEYMNSSSANQITKLLMLTKENPYIKECIINWYFEVNDEDNYDFGKELEAITDYKFNFFEYAEA
jgi:uncharacterized Fe-S radical SAM superfamily protein PflX